MAVILKDLMTTEGIYVRHVHHKNASEIETFERLWKQDGIVVTYEYSKHSTFAMLKNQVSAMIVGRMFCCC